jgi:glycine/D-amino acid oxidase-like deaminating enzyme
MDAIEARLHQYFPRLRAVGITHRWTGTLGITLSRVCSMGTLPGHDSVLYAVGFSGHGVTLANLAGEVLTDLYSGDNGRWRGQPFLQKRLGGIPPDPLRWIGYHLYTRLTGRSPRRST